MTLALVIFNVVAFFLELASPESAIDAFALWPLSAAGTDHTFHWWQILTYSALHANFLHLAVNMFGLQMFGREVERVFGAGRLLKLYVMSVAGGALTQLCVAAFTHGPDYPTIGASAGVFGLLIAYALLFPTRRIVLLFPPIPMPAWLFAIVYTLIELVLGVSGTEAGVAHFAHLGGVAGALLLLVRWLHPARPTGHTR